jgi:L-iditol 2-dehydrogenase
VMPFVLPGVVRIPEKNSLEEGAMLEPVNTVLKAVKRLSLLRGDTVLVAGQGPIGLMFTRILQLRGMRVLATDIMESRLKLARKFGASRAMRPSKLKSQVSDTQSLDAAVLAVPSDAALHQAIEWVRDGGQVLLFAHTRRGSATGLDMASVCVDEKDLIGSYSADFTLQAEVARLVFSRKLDVRPLITHRLKLSQVSYAVNIASHPTADSLKILVEVTQPLG